MSKKTGDKKLKTFSVEIERSSVQRVTVEVQMYDDDCLEEKIFDNGLFDEIPDEDWEYMDGGDEIREVTEVK